MAEQKGRPVPKRRSVHLEPSRNEPFSTADMYGGSHDPIRNTESSPDASGLPSCVKLRRNVVSADQKNKDSKLPLLLHQLDDACKKCSNDVPPAKFSLAILCLQAASSPIRKYRILRYFEILENNKNDISKVPGALSILEKYAINLLRDEKPVKWKEIKYSTAIIQNKVFPVVGAFDVLQQMGYTQVSDSALTFPCGVDQPNIATIVVLTADLSIARYETEVLMNNKHPFLIFNQFGSGASNTPELTGGSMLDGGNPGGYVSGFCGVCSEQNLTTACAECDMQFCEDCDGRWHNHKFRRSHVRTSLLSDRTSEEKTDTRRRPVPVPRQKKSQKDQTGNSQNFQEPYGEQTRASSGNYASSTFEHFPHNPSDNQEIKRPPSQSGNMRSPGNRTSPMNVHANPAHQYINRTYGTVQFGFQSPGRIENPHLGQNVGGAQGFNQSESRRPDFNQSSERVQEPNQSGRKTLHRVLSCPNCSLLYPDAQTRCPSCNVSLNPDSQGDATFTPRAQQAGLNLAAAKLPTNMNSNLPSGSDGQPLLKNLAKAQELTNRRLPDPPRAPGVATRVNHVDNTESVYEEVDNMLEWVCEHCTCSNPLTTKVCQVCCKTPSDLKKFPNIVEKSAMSPPQNSKIQNEGIVGSQQTPMVATGTQQGHRDVYMTPKDRPLEGGIYMSRNEGDTQSLPAKKQYTDEMSPGGRVLNAQKYREQELSEKEKGKIFFEEKKELFKQGLITEEDVYTIDTEDKLHKKVEAMKRMMGSVIVPSQGYPVVEPSQGYPVVDPRKGYPVVDPRKGYPVVDPRKGYPVAEPSQGYSASNPGSDLGNEQLLQLLKSGVITEQDLVNNGVTQSKVDPRPGSEPRSRDVNAEHEATKRLLDQTTSKHALMGQSHHGSTSLYDVPTKRQDERKDEMSLSEEQLQLLLKEGGFQDANPVVPPSPQPAYQPSHRPVFQPSPQTVIPPSPQYLTQVGPESKLTNEERFQLYQAGIISLQDYVQNIQPDNQPIYDIPKPNIDYQPIYDIPKPDIPANPADIQSMFAEFQTLQTFERSPDSRQNYDNFPNKTFQNFNVRRSAPVVDNIYDKLSKPLYTSLPSQTSKDTFSAYLNSQTPLENLTRGNFIDAQSQLYVEWIKQADKYGFTPEELNLANHFNWKDPKERNPVQWLKDEWTGRVAEVIGRVTQQTSNENDRVGNLSTEEAKKALLENHGSVESACKACIESRREKLAKMGEISVFGRQDCLNALDRNEGDLEKALLELEQKAMEPIRKRVLGLQDLEDGGSRSGLLRAYEEVVKNKNISFERRVRVVYVERKIQSWGRAETVVKLVDMGFKVEDCIEAADAYGDLRRSLGYLQQECPICMELKPMGQMITFLSCQDKTCKDCVAEYLTSRIKEFQIHQIVCPVCDLPDLTDEVVAADYFNNLDVMVRELVEPEVHDVFQKKLRDRALRKEENFRWCAHCSCGFINEQPNVNKMQCPNCLNFTCFGCKKPWEDQHQGITCDQFAQWKLENDEEFQLAGLAGHLARNGIDCPECKFRYDLARGGCMHFKCGQCGHEFCSGCYNPFKHRGKCNVFRNCQGMGMHAHHPRDCLFYIRDWEPQILQELLQENGVNYEAGARGLPVQDDEIGNEDDEEGAVGGGPQLCKVMEQRDLGMEDVECGRPCQPGHDGLCKIHYNEYLVDLINKNGIDPADKMNIDEMIVVYNRAELQPVAKEQGEDDNAFRERLLAHLKQQIPLPQPPGLRLPAGEEQGEEEELP